MDFGAADTVKETDDDFGPKKESPPVRETDDGRSSLCSHLKAWIFD